MREIRYGGGRRGGKSGLFGLARERRLARGPSKNFRKPTAALSRLGWRRDRRGAFAYARFDALYRLAWDRGLKTTYYLRSRSATHVEKSTLKGTDGKLNAVSATAAVKPSAGTTRKSSARRSSGSSSPRC